MRPWIDVLEPRRSASQRVVSASIPEAKAEAPPIDVVTVDELRAFVEQGKPIPPALAKKLDDVGAVFGPQASSAIVRRLLELRKLEEVAKTVRATTDEDLRQRDLVVVRVRYPFPDFVDASWFEWGVVPPVGFEFVITGELWREMRPELREVLELRRPPEKEKESPGWLFP